MTFSAKAYDHMLGKLLSHEVRPGELLDHKRIAREIAPRNLPGRNESFTWQLAVSCSPQ